MSDDLLFSDVLYMLVRYANPSSPKCLVDFLVEIISFIIFLCMTHWFYCIHCEYEINHIYYSVL